MKFIKAIKTHKGLIKNKYHCFITGMFFACLAFNTAAQVPLQDINKNKKKALIPNLSVHFTLNSALSQEETEYYKEIVQEILKKMPKQVALTGENRSLLSGSNHYDRLRVVSYLPDMEAVEENPTAKDIHYFDIQFEVPDQKKLRQILRQEKKQYNPSVFVRTDKLDAFMQKVDLLRMGEEIEELPQERENLENQAISSEVLEKPETLKIAKLQEPDVTSSLTKQTNKEAKERPTKAEKKELKKVKNTSKKETVIPKKPAPKTFTINYSGDRIDFTPSKDLETALKTAKSVCILSQTMNSPFLEAETLYETRLGVLVEKINVATLIKSEIRLKSNTKQYFKIIVQQ